MIRSLHVLPALEEGGVERTVVQEALLEQSLGILPLVVSSGGSMAGELLAAGIEHLTLPMASKNPLTIVLNAQRLATLIRQRQIEIVHAHSRAPAWSAYLACQATKAIFVTTFHGIYSGQNFIKRWYNGVMVRGAAVIAASTQVREHLIAAYGVSLDKVRVIPLWSSPPLPLDAGEMDDFRRQYGLPEEGRVIAMVGRLTRLKGHEVLIRAFALLRDKTSRLLVVGHPKRPGYGDELRALCRALGIADRVVFAGGGTTTAQLAYESADVVVSASLQPESFGLTMLEAACRGIPVVATAHGGALDLVIPGETGFLSPVGDPAALAAGIERVLDLTPGEYRRMGEQARQHGVRFDRKNSGSRLAALYEELLTPTRRQ